mmetsp:Transcript_780/g.1222  ORF Transcript_780/g.1222 Transcript_780/m.1222 type:complete len:373 (-) Transcript_780:304-1422(-)
MKATTIRPRRPQQQRTISTLVKCTIMLLLLFSPAQIHGWEWSDFIIGGGNDSSSTTTLSMYEISDMRVRDIKRRLARTHGYSADEIGKMLDKKELIEALSYEEYRVKQAQDNATKRERMKFGIIAALSAISLVLFWPLLSHVFEVAHVNFVVYTDRKKVECTRCLELKSMQGMVGIFLMFVLDFLGLWLSTSVILSWVMTSKYFFPVPSLPIRPAAMMGGQVAAGPLAKYGLNVGPMVITWGLRFLNVRLESWTGKALLRADKQAKKAARAWESKEERAARKAAKRERKAAREAAKQQAEEERRQTAPPPPSAQQQQQQQSQTAPDPFKEPPSRDEARDAAAAAAESRWNESHGVDFKASLETPQSAMDELD